VERNSLNNLRGSLSPLMFGSPRSAVSSADEDGESFAGSPQRIFMDGAFDLTHYGHFNALRLGKELGTYLVVGVNSSVTVQKEKGFAPVLTDSERQIMVESCRFVDKIVPESPYVMTREYINHIRETEQIDYFAHGSDPCLVNGEDVYAEVKRMGCYMTVPRTKGISTTDLVGRMLLYGQSLAESADAAQDGGSTSASSPTRASRTSASPVQPERFHVASRFCCTSALLQAFSQHCGPPRPGQKTVYFPNAWDVFNAGHVLAMRDARELFGGDVHLLVGIYDDRVVQEQAGKSFPMLSFYERVLSVLGCRHTDDILLPAPAPEAVTRKFLEDFNIDAVAVLDTGRERRTPADVRVLQQLWTDTPELEKVAQLVVLPPRLDLSVETVVGRLMRNYSSFSQRYQDKIQTEVQY